MFITKNVLIVQYNLLVLTIYIKISLNEITPSNKKSKSNTQHSSKLSSKFTSNKFTRYPRKYPRKPIRSNKLLLTGLSRKAIVEPINSPNEKKI